MIPQNAGYIFNFAGHGAFSPDGKIENQPTQAEIDEHNARLAVADMEALRATGRGILYIHRENKTPTHVSTWHSTPSTRIKINNWRKGRHNMARQRLDVWFYLDGKCYHGVNIGDNDIVRVKRNKN